MAAHGDELWVIKVPHFLKQHIEDAHAAGKQLGTVQPNMSSGGSMTRPGGSCVLSLSGAVLPEGVPTDYELRFTTPPAATYIMSRAKSSDPAKPTAEAARHEGRVTAKGEIRMSALTSEYRSLVKERRENAEDGRARSGTIQDDSEIRKTQLNHRQTQQDEKADKLRKLERREQSSQNKRTKIVLSAREMQDRLMELFGEKPYWSKRDLEYKVGRDGLTKALDELCVKITKKGPNCMDFQLKPELRVGLPSSSAARS